MLNWSKSTSIVTVHQKANFLANSPACNLLAVPQVYASRLGSYRASMRDGLIAQKWGAAERLPSIYRWSSPHSRLVLLLTLLLSLITHSGCSSITSQPEENIYYTLEYDPPGENLRELVPQPLTLRMERFTIAPDYDTARIVYRDASYTRGTYANHRWHANPEQLVRSFLGRDLQAAGIFQAVFTDAATLGASYGLSGTVEEFLELEENSHWEAVLTLTITLVNRTPGSDPAKKILFQKRFSAREKASEKTPQALAQAMSLALRELSGTITLAIKEATAPHHQPAASAPAASP